MEWILVFSVVVQSHNLMSCFNDRSEFTLMEWIIVLSIVMLGLANRHSVTTQWRTVVMHFEI